MSIQSPAGVVEGWLLPGDGASADSPGPAIIYAHGNGGLIDYFPEPLEPYRRRGVSVLLPEYRGYGRSAGVPSERAITRDFVAFYDLLASRDDIDSQRIVFHGRSLGGGAVCALAEKRPPAGLILESTFTSVRALARRFLFPGLLIADPFDSARRLAGYSKPLLVIHGRLDRVVPYSHGQKLHALVPGAEMIAYDHCGHNDLPQDAQYWEAVARLLEAI